MSDDKCPVCGDDTVCDSVDVGVGVIEGPPYCCSCGWSAYHNAGKVIDGFYHTSDGTCIRVDSIVERAKHFGVDPAFVHGVFKDDAPFSSQNEDVRR